MALAQRQGVKLIDYDSPIAPKTISIQKTLTFAKHIPDAVSHNKLKNAASDRDQD